MTNVSNRFNANDIIGVNPIIAVPFTADGKIDEASFNNILDFLSSLEIQGATLFGVASEFPKLTDKEKERLTELFLAHPNSHYFKAFSVTDHATEVAVDNAQRYEALGADALMLLPPFFLTPRPSEVISHIEKVLGAVEIPIMVQYAPSETGFQISPEEMSQLGEKYPNAVFKIECNPPVPYTELLLQYYPQATVLNGYAGLYMLDILKAGGKGVMPGCSFTEVYIQIYKLWQEKQFEQAYQLHAKLFEYIQEWMTHCEYIIQVEKTILYKRGIIGSDYCRHPNFELSAHDYQRIDQFIAEFGLSIRS